MELLWCAPPWQQDHLPNAALCIGSDAVQLVRYMCNLGIYTDSNISMWTHISRTMSNCVSALQQLQSIRKSISQPVQLSWVTSLILTRLHYGSVALSGVPGQLLNWLQSILNTAGTLPVMHEV